MEAPDWAKANSLQYCMLEISQKKQNPPWKFWLSKPDPLPLIPYPFAGRNALIDLGLSSNAVKDPTVLMLDLELSGVGQKTLTQNGLRAGSIAKFSIKPPAVKVGNPQIEFVIQFQYDKKQQRPFGRKHHHFANGSSDRCLTTT